MGGNGEVLVKNRVKWPHEYVLLGLNKEHATSGMSHSGWLGLAEP